MKHLGIMGGTFNPIRTRELLIAQRALDQFALDKVLLMTNGNPPHKRSDPNYELLDKELRWQMVAASVKDNRRLEASRLEVDRRGVTWTIDTLIELQRLHKDARLSFICGADTVASLARYDRRAEFLALCRLLVAPRDCAHEGLLAEWRSALPEGDIERIDVPPDASSSTMVRQWIANGHSVKYLVPRGALGILKRRRYYRR